MSKFLYIIIISAIISCSEGNPNPGKFDSDDCENKTERIKALEKEIKSFSEIFDAEFELFNVNGFGNQLGIPGASSWDYKFAIRIDPNDIPKWTKGFNRMEMLDGDQKWIEKIVKNRKENWIRKSKPEYFKRNNENVVLIVFREEGIIFKRVITM